MTDETFFSTLDEWTRSVGSKSVPNVKIDLWTNYLKEAAQFCNLRLNLNLTLNPVRAPSLYITLVLTKLLEAVDLVVM